MKSYSEFDRETLDRLYNPETGAPDLDDFRNRYKAESEKVRVIVKCRLDQAYGPGEAQKLDVYLTEKPHAPVFAFIHGGAWRGSNKHERAFPALAFSRAGAVFVSIEYPLAPIVSLDEIVRQVSESVIWLHRNAKSFGADPHRIHVAGNSAGAHLAAMLLATDWTRHGLPPTVCASGCLISGLFDLEPMRLTRYNDWLHLDSDAAARNSPLFHLPQHGCPLIVAVGRNETSEFVRQSAAYFDAWVERGFHGSLMVMPGFHHFSILGELGNPAGPLFHAILHQIGLGPRPF